jgi:hypothetical protein
MCLARFSHKIAAFALRISGPNFRAEFQGNPTSETSPEQFTLILNQLQSGLDFSSSSRVRYLDTAEWFDLPVSLGKKIAEIHRCLAHEVVVTDSTGICSGDGQSRYAAARIEAQYLHQFNSDFKRSSDESVSQADHGDVCCLAAL